MKKIVLNGRQVVLLNKVSVAGYSFFSSVEEFLEKQKKLPEEESAEIEIKMDEYHDLLDMINRYLGSDSISEDDSPSDKEREDLKELLGIL